MKIDIQTANNELQVKTYEEIQAETAWKWASRSVAAFLRSSGAKGIDEKIRWLAFGIEYEGEAVEHAAFSVDGAAISQVRKTIKSYKTKAIQEIKQWKNV